MDSSEMMSIGTKRLLLASHNVVEQGGRMHSSDVKAVQVAKALTLSEVAGGTCSCSELVVLGQLKC